MILNFWATWCGPCIAAMPHVNELEAALDPKTFVFIALDDEDETVVKAFLAKRKISSIVALDMKRAEDVPLRAQPTFNAHTSSGVERHGSTIKFSNYSMAALAMHLEKKYGRPVVDETGVSGGFDGSLSLPVSPDDLSESLRCDLGLYVERGTRSISKFVVSRRKEGKTQ